MHWWREPPVLDAYFLAILSSATLYGAGRYLKGSGSSTPSTLAGGFGGAGNPFGGMTTEGGLISYISAGSR
ncbi:MAG: hypothetical protein FI729_03255 [SAR202 cluster bacterium]|nr:hypothetical protein [SAR202 cluster bacterium]